MTPTTTSESILITFLIILGIQLVFYILSASLKTEKLYDLSGALTYQTVILVATLNKTSVHPRQIILAVFGLVWATRLGLFLFIRVMSVPDKRLFVI